MDVESIGEPHGQVSVKKKQIKIIFTSTFWTYLLLLGKLFVINPGLAVVSLACPLIGQHPCPSHQACCFFIFVIFVLLPPTNALANLCTPMSEEVTFKPSEFVIRLTLGCSENANLLSKEHFFPLSFTGPSWRGLHQGYGKKNTSCLWEIKHCMEGRSCPPSSSCRPIAKCTFGEISKSHLIY